MVASSFLGKGRPRNGSKGEEHMTTAEELVNSCSNLLNAQQRQMLQDLSKVRQDKNYSAMPNYALDEYITTLKDLYPAKFHNRHTLTQRVFMDEPANVDVPYTKFVRTKNESPIKQGPKK